jgi:hypothetical protein
MNRKSRLDDKAARDALRQQGIEFVVLPPGEVAKLRAAAEQTIKRLAQQGVVPQDLVNELNGYLDAYRRGKPAH